VTWKSYKQDKLIKLFFSTQHKHAVPSPVRMDKLKVLIYHRGYRMSMKELYDKNWAFGTYAFLGRELHNIWMGLENLGRSFELDMNSDQEHIMLRCVQYYSHGSPLFTGKPGPAAFPRAFLDGYLNKSILYQHSPDVSIQIHIVEPEKDMVILTYSFGTLATILKNALEDIGKEEMRPELMTSVGKQLMEMFQINKDELERAGFPVDDTA
jgi:hypothetical protein